MVKPLFPYVQIYVKDKNNSALVLPDSVGVGDKEITVAAVHKDSKLVVGEQLILKGSVTVFTKKIGQNEVLFIDERDIIASYSVE